MSASVYELVTPSQACHRLGHRIEERPKSPGPGSYEYCYVCSVGYQMAMESLGDSEAADRFVQQLRRGEGAS